MLGQVAKLRSGDFDESLIQSILDNYKLSEMRKLESNEDMAMSFVESFINGHNWKDDALQMQRLEKITKQQIVDWANEYLGANSYVAVYKRIGEDKSARLPLLPSLRSRPTVTTRASS